jgi:hypothetical protein
MEGKVVEEFHGHQSHLEEPTGDTFNGWWLAKELGGTAPSTVALPEPAQSALCWCSCFTHILLSCTHNLCWVGQAWLFVILGLGFLLLKFDRSLSLEVKWVLMDPKCSRHGEEVGGKSGILDLCLRAKEVCGSPVRPPSALPIAFAMRWELYRIMCEHLGCEVCTTGQSFSHGLEPTIAPSYPNPISLTVVLLHASQ